MASSHRSFGKPPAAGEDGTGVTEVASLVSPVVALASPAAS